MPSKSLKQNRFFTKVANSKAFAEKVGVKQSVAREFLEGDKALGQYQYPKASKKHKGWYEVEGYPYFLASRDGKVRNAKTGYETYGSLDDKGYRRVCQWDNTTKRKKEYKAHVIVCTAFHGPKPGTEYEVGHKDHDRSNNAPSNLHWITRKSNMAIANKRRVSTESYEGLNSAYVSRVPDEASKDILTDIQARLGLSTPIPVDDLHLTLLYSPEHGLVDYDTGPRVLVVRGTWSLEHLGEDEMTPALVLHGDEQLQARHQQLRDMGGRHTYIPYLAHVSLSYDDHVSATQARSVRWDATRTLRFVDEYLKPIDDDDDDTSLESHTEAPYSMAW